MKTIATNLPLDDFRPQRIYYVGFNFDDYPQVSIRELHLENMRLAKEKKREAAMREKSRWLPDESNSARSVVGVMPTCGMGKVEELSPDGPVVGSKGGMVRKRVPRYGMDDLFNSPNESLKPVTTRRRIDSHWGHSVWPTGGF